MTAQFKVNGEVWTVGEFPALKEWLKIRECDLPDLYEFCQKGWRNRKVWMILQELYAVSSPTQAREVALDMDEIRAKLSLSVSTTQNYLYIFRRDWADYAAQKKEERKAEAATQGVQQELVPQPKAAQSKYFTPPDTALTIRESEILDDDCPLTPEQLRLIKDKGFSMRIFAADERRGVDERHSEMIWFAERLVELDKLLSNPSVKALAREMIFNELAMRRINELMATSDTLSPHHMKALEWKQKVEEQNRKTIAQIEELAPDAKSLATKIEVVRNFSDLIRAGQEYRSDKNNTLIGGFMTQLEIQVELRASEQIPELRLRPSLFMMLQEARKGLWDRNFKSSLTPAQCKIMDLTLQLSAIAYREKHGVVLVDLLKDGPLGEYPSLAEFQRQMEDQGEKTEERTSEIEEAVAVPDESISLQGDALEDSP